MKAQKNQEVSASEFKKHCLQLFQEIKVTGKPIVVTKRSTPIVKIIPFNTASEQQKPSYFGFLSKTVTINGDIVNFSTQDEWEINNE